ncbi:MAG TPA: ATP-binding cassette domain-containing protein [Burkholderiales bacterium]|nr:ATP-binding cassette domain-containing protein [Burkholderiales bacterium]
MLSLKGVRHRYGAHEVLHLERFEAAQGEKWLVLGPSGSGKSTLLHLIAGLLKPSEGTLEAARPIGIVPQKLHLIASLTVAQNLLLAQYLAGAKQEPARAAQVLASVGLAERAAARPHQLSHGQAQRVAVARAVMNRPKLLIADEPTSNLDDAHCAAALDLLEAQAAECGATLVVATHDARARARFAHRLELGA